MRGGSGSTCTNQQRSPDMPKLWEFKYFQAYVCHQYSNRKRQSNISRPPRYGMLRQLTCPGKLFRTGVLLRQDCVKKLTEYYDDVNPFMTTDNG